MRSRLLQALLTLALSPCAAQALEIRSYTASELGFLASSHLLFGDEEALLVDAQFTRSDAYEVVRMVRSTERRLTTIFVTHARPEHYLGLEVLLEHFPEARVLARLATAEAIRGGGEDVIASWQPIYLDDLPSTVVVPAAFEGDALELEGVEIRLLDFKSRPTALYVASEQTLLASDYAFDKVHLWLERLDLDAWSASLGQLRALEGLTWVYPGHGKGAGPELLEASTGYVDALKQALARDRTGAEVVRAMRETYPEHRLPVLLERSMRAVRP